VGTEKRERQKANRQARLAELEKQQRRSNTRKRVIRITVIVVLALAAAFGLSRLISGGNESVNASGTTVAGTIPGESVPVGTAAPTVSTVPGRAITGTTPCPATDGSSARASSFAQPPPMCIDPTKTYKALVQTDKGNFTITLDATKAPKTVNNFVVLSRYHFYDGLPFHRILPGFVVQGGDPQGTGGGGPGYTFEDELPKALSDYKVGSVAMANSAPDTNGSQFFVLLGTGKLGSPSYSLFGQVTDGFDTTVKALEAAGAAGQTPLIKSVTITES